MRALPILLLALPLAAAAHDIWIDVEPFTPAAGAESAVTLAGGHYFPASATVVADRLIRRAAVRLPGGGETNLVTTATARQRDGKLAFPVPGTYRMDLVLQKPQLPKPDAWAKAIVQCGSGPADLSAYAVGQGLEIVPRADLSALRPGASLPLEVHNDGVAIAGKLQVMAAAGGTAWLDARPEQPAELTVKKPGRYLVTCERGSQACSLTFIVAGTP